MRISDWSSDVCSSDLASASIIRRKSVSSTLRRGPFASRLKSRRNAVVRSIVRMKIGEQRIHGRKPLEAAALDLGEGGQRFRVGRSEEHTSELQSLMRISYAVFCLKKKKTYIST